MAFKPKVKEPILSEEVQNIINRSIDEKNRNNYDDIFRIKNKIVQNLINNQDILHSLHYQKDVHEDIIDGTSYKDTCIFDDLKIPNKESEVKSYICFEVDDTTSYDSRIVKTITFRIIVHEDDLLTDWGINRKDLLSLIIKNEFDWNHILGTTMQKTKDFGYIADTVYHCRDIEYQLITPNNISNKNKYGTKI